MIELIFVEETIIKKQEYDKLSEFVSNRQPSTHWIQVGSSKEACPVFDGDARIVRIDEWHI